MKLKSEVSKAAATVYGVLAGVVGAAFAGGVTAAANYIQNSGGTQDWKAVASAAAAGAILTAGALFVKSPQE